MSDTPILQVDAIRVAYGGLAPAVSDVSLTVPKGGFVALLGGNGAGKTTTLKAVSNLVRAERGALEAGRIIYRGESVANIDPWSLAKRGLVQVLEGRRCFAHLTVEENLRIGAFVHRPTRRALGTEVDRVYAIFPRLKERRHALAGHTSGGEQQMVALGRALVARPSLILLDEPSMGLAPHVVEEIFEVVAALNRDEGVSVLLAEQNAAVALRHAQYGYVLESGRVVAQGPAAQLASSDVLRDAYLGGAKRAGVDAAVGLQ
ncbi:ABC transporter ATP-binding protein [Paraburkholderia sp. SUR17]|uniref:ABC transporter ATP-binding protein n=1 Tax=Paraburkholderia sp. SUR17 TaxID=3034358 RepID=UPI0024083D5B|nr:ABC transporter ATP-binding protein [Paraburkholderia sp. SUR17]WEY41781.1 ABC transporter ATP-binding protein [Paraburkholderia sp. SUR17]